MAQNIYYSNMVVNNSVYKSFRIPVIVKLNNNDILAFAEARKNSPKDYGDISIVLRRSVDNGKTWSTPTIICSIPKSTLGNPTPIIDKTFGSSTKSSIIHLLMTWNKINASEEDIINGKSIRLPYYSKSIDNGFTWSTPICLDQCTNKDWCWYATGPCVGLQIQNGKYKNRLIVPCNHSLNLSKNKKLTKDTVHRAHVIYSDDDGNTWHIGNSLPKRTNESCIVEMNDGTLLINSRLQGMEYRSFAISNDGGITWNNFHIEYKLKTAICQGSILLIDNMLLMSCITEAKRANLVIYASLDKTKHCNNYNNKNCVYSTYSMYSVYSGSSSYSNMIQIDDEYIGIIYEKNRYTNIILEIIPIKEIIKCLLITIK